MTPSPEPVEIPYKRWRNKRKGYEVEIVGVYHNRNREGLWHTTVKAKRDDGRTTSWPAKTFLRTFEAIGGRMRVAPWWQRVRRRDWV